MIPLMIAADSKTQAKKYLKNLLHQKARIEIEPEKEKIKIDDIRKLKKKLSLLFEKKTDIIIWWFDTATIEAQNSSLKLLEEYSLKFNFYLIVKNPNILLPTIISRVRIVDIRDKDKITKTSDKELSVDSLTFKEIKTKEEAINFLNQVIIVLREKYKSSLDPNLITIVKKALQLLYLLKNNNLNPQLTIDYLLTSLLKKFNIKKI